MARILIVDDAAFMRLSLKQILAANDHEVVAEAQTGKEAIQAYDIYRPDIVTMDITMPDMDGIEAVKRIKELDPKAKIIMCSAMGQQQMILRAIEAGAMDFIVKPFHHNRVIGSIANAL
ncbi:response regulator [Paenibacillus whitsoniae]|uniref:Response regulator n=1 Tax=Paenibacillus whitsoniae TaxID=2496558 RepID=A0A430JK24_9BACL|nr:response regulator [Paenibacillus whitsoniae]RTE11388.1 response regulator [Paenibacillus whitsoniae]